MHLASHRGYQEAFESWTSGIWGFRVYGFGSSRFLGGCCTIMENQIANIKRKLLFRVFMAILGIGVQGIGGFVA